MIILLIALNVRAANAARRIYFNVRIAMRDLSGMTAAKILVAVWNQKIT